MLNRLLTSTAFAFIKPYLPVLLALIPVIAYSAGWVRGYSSANMSHKLAEKEAQILALERDKAVLDNLVKKQEMDKATLEGIALADAAIIAGYEERLKRNIKGGKNEKCSCTITGDFIDANSRLSSKNSKR